MKHFSVDFYLGQLLGGAYCVFFCFCGKEIMNIKEIKQEFGDCDWMRAFLNGYTVDAILWLINRVEELEKELEGLRK